jgi:glutamate N-acetyltransferase/amino-acid N-acetyltransferase
LKLPLGYRYASAYAGIRKQSDQHDLALIVPDGGATAAAVFTKNVVKAAPVLLAKRNLESTRGKVAAILVNAGNANCATRTGGRVATTSTTAVAKALKTKAKYVLPASTGVIGVELDPQLLTAAIPKLVQDLSPGEAAFGSVARAIMTTDTRPKIASEDVTMRRGRVTVAGMTKGSGMIHPNMATTLGFVMTDAAIEPKVLQRMLARATGRSYNSLSVDGDMSTNDMVAVLANGASGVSPSAKELLVVEEVLCWVMESLAEQIAADGEGARKLVIVRTLGFKNDDDARKVARAVANSPLVKTAIAGSDPNWGRILAAAGYSGVLFDPSKIDIHLQQEVVCQGGVAAKFDEAAMKKKLDSSEVLIRITLRGKSTGEARFYTCDLTEGYIEINGSYRT